MRNLLFSLSQECENNKCTTRRKAVIFSVGKRKGILTEVRVAATISIDMANFQLRFKRKEQVAEGTWSFYFDKPADFVFEAGQYVALVLPRLVAPDKRGPVRSLSMCSAPCEADLMFTVRITETGYKQSIMTLEPGDVAQATRPIGHFTLSHAADGKPIVFIVGGIGITPVRSILVQAAHDQSERCFTLFYSNRTAQDAAFHEELGHLGLPHCTVIKTFTQETVACADKNEERGYICESMLKKYLPVAELQENWYYLVGAPAFIEAMETMLSGIGIAKERMVNDPFTGMESASRKTK